MNKIILLCILVFNYTYAFDKFSIGLTKGNSSENGYNLALEKEFEYKLFSVTDLSIEASLDYINSKKDNLSIFSLQPMLSYYLTNKLYIKGGIGIAYFSEKELSDKLFGTHFQFKESFGIGYKFNKKLETALKYVHYSNADISSENSGIDMGLLQLIYRF